MRAEQTARPTEVGEAVFTLAADGKIVAWSEAAARLYGWAAAQVTGQGVEVLYFPDQPPRRLAELLVAAEQESPRREVVHRQRRAGGEEIVVELRAAPADRVRAGGSGALLVSVRDVTRRVRAERALGEAHSALERSRREVRRLAARLLSVREEERRRLGRELHDGLSQRLSMLVVELGGACREPGAPSAETLAALRSQATALADEARTLSHQLHPAAVERCGLAAALRDHCAELRRSTGLEVDLRLDEGVDPLPEDFALALYRIAQEGLHNVVRHAGVREARLELRCRPGAVGLSLADAGAGFDLAAPREGGLGLVGMEERARLLGGSLRVDSAPGLGTEIEAVLPLDEAPAAGQAAVRETADAGAAVAPARFLGPYRLLEVLGKGATSTVYLAEEPEPLKRRVALKLQRAPLAGYRAALRFKAEHRALARLHHPNVAQVYEASTTEDGDPYLTVEYVPGIPITAYCDRYRLGLEERLELFVEVCGGVLHAHQKGVLHRDLKPSNILVAEEHGRPVPKILDFGIAKGLDEALAEGTVWTRGPAGSPAYMSPEAFAGGEVDTRSDVYSLGVLLHELLTGTLPAAGGVLPGTPASARWSGPLPRPSRRLRSLEPETAARVAGDRRTQPAALARQLVPDLDWVVLKALAREPTERYAGAAELAQDVARYLRGEPVAAGPPSAPYRLRKLVQRHRGAAAAALLVALALVGGLLATATQARRAEREAASAEQVAGFLAELFKASDPAQARGGDLSARELLDLGAERVERELGGQPLIQARLMDTIGEIYSELGLYGPARPLLERSVELRTALLGEEHLEVAASLQDLADLYQRSGGEAEPLYRRALAIREEALGPDHPLVADVLSNLAVLHARRGQFDRAEELLERALSIRERAVGPDHTDVAKALNNLAGVYQYTGRLEEAEPLHRRALEIRTRALPADHPDLAASLNALASLYTAQQRWEEAVPLLERALAALEQALGPEHPRVATALQGLGVAQRQLGDAGAAENAFRRALATREQIQGPDHPDLAYPLHHLGSLCVEQGRLAEAEPLYRRALALAEEGLEPSHPLRVSILDGLIGLLRQTGREAEAAALEARATGG